LPFLTGCQQQVRKINTFFEMQIVLLSRGQDGSETVFDVIRMIHNICGIYFSKVFCGVCGG
jgi:phage terminase Nu1 subunit (DNA packaging protein)